MFFLDKLTVGADPELFVKSGRHFLSGHLFPCGTKYEPLRTEHAWIQNDGIALEINTRPARNQTEFVTNCTNALNDLRSFVRQKDPQADIVIKPSIFFGREKLKKLPEIARQLGCTPDFTVGSFIPNATPNIDAPFRTGAGHIHIGWTKDADTDITSKHADICRRMVQAMDFFVGLPSLLWDDDDRRRQLYGRASCFRVKPYGVEYRTLSNAWLRSPELMAYVYQQTVKAVTEVENGQTFFNSVDHPLVAAYIDTNNRTFVSRETWMRSIENVA